MKQPTTKQPTTKQPTMKQPTTKQPTTKQPTRPRMRTRARLTPQTPVKVLRQSTCKSMRTWAHQPQALPSA